MRKLFTNKNKKGFAMAELLAVSIVLLFIFSILFSNYLPLLAEYETRLSYNDVTAQYAAHYIRKMYKEALDDTTQSETLKTTINPDINSKGFYSALNKDSNSVCNQVLEKDKSNCEKIIEQYGIEEIIITKYKLKDDNDSTTEYVKNNYEQKDGSLYNYINYLPNYEKSIYTGNTANDEGEQLYRLILKTEDFGYATTPILSDYKTPGSCFKGKRINDSNDDLVITHYSYSVENGCGDTVTINNRRIKIENDQGTGEVTGKIAAIGDGVFEGKQNGSNPASQVKIVILPEKNGVKSIGENAFKNSNLNSIFNLDKVDSIGNSAFESTQLEGVTLTADNKYIGEKAFANTEKIEEVNLEDFPSGNTMGDYAFSSNKKLTTIKLPDNNIYSPGTILTKGLFKESGTDASGIAVEIPGGMTNIGEEMFYLAKISGITLNDGVQTIGDRAFSQYNNTNKEGTGKADDVTITANVERIGEDSFRGLNITTLTFNDGNVPLSIGMAAFKQNAIGYLEIPSRVNNIGANAFENSGIQTLTFDSNDKITSISKQAFYNNNINKPLVIPEKVESIGTQAFSENISLSDLTLPSELETIGSSAFSHTALTNITIPESVTSIGGSAFKDSKLENVEIVDGEISLSLQNAVFQGNKSLKEFTIPSRVSFIGDNIFYGIGEDAKILNKSSSLKDIDWCSKFALNINCHTEVDQNDENKLTIIYEDEVDSAIKYTRYVYNMGGVTNE